jgi:type VI secretion system secreted protein VgrG
VVRPRGIPAGDGPTVTQVLRYGYHYQPTVIVVHFSRALDAASASNVGQYTLVNLGGPGRGGSRVGQRIAIGSAVYDPQALTVTLHPVERLNVHNRYQLVIRGTGKSGLVDTAGRLLDGLRNGRPGSNFSGLLTRQSLAGRASAAASFRPPVVRPVIANVSALAFDSLASSTILPVALRSKRRADRRL